MDIGGLVLVEVLAGPQVTMIGIIPVRVTNTNAKALCFCATFYHVPCSPWVSKMKRMALVGGRWTNFSADSSHAADAILWNTG